MISLNAITAFYPSAIRNAAAFRKHILKEYIQLLVLDQWCISSSQVGEDEVEYEVSESLTYPHTHTLTNM